MDSVMQKSVMKNAKGFTNLAEAQAEGYEIIFDSE
jgi:hypothetical protein